MGQKHPPPSICESDEAFVEIGIESTSHATEAEDGAAAAAAGGEGVRGSSAHLLASDTISGASGKQQEQQQQEQQQQQQQRITLDAALTEHVGSLGLGQAIVLIAASMSWISLACVALSMVFFSKDPIRSQSWRCVNASDAACAAAFAAAPTDPAPFCALGRQQYRFEPMRSSAASEMGLVCRSGWKAAVANSAYFAGIWVGSTPFG